MLVVAEVVGPVCMIIDKCYVPTYTNKKPFFRHNNIALWIKVGL